MSFTILLLCGTRWGMLSDTLASAVNDTTREVGAALAIALAGSILAARYGRLVTPRLAAFPEPLRGPASHSLAQALQISKALGPQGN